MARVAVLFDFDGTLGDTETPAMEVAFWEIAPYLPDLVWQNSFGLEDQKTRFIEDNAGRAFEFMVEDCNKERAKRGLPPVEEAWKEPPPEPLASVINSNRVNRFGLKMLSQVVGGRLYTSILQQQKEETNEALAVCTVPNPGVPEVCEQLTQRGIPFCISTTSGKPRVPISVKAAGLEPYFPPEKIHSGESDFDPPRFKPDPSVYLRAAESEGAQPENCVAVEDSGSGVGSAANANLGLIIGYVGGTHIPANKKDEHAKMLMSGSKSKNGRGADLVVEEFSNITLLVEAFNADRQSSGHKAPSFPYTFPPEVIGRITGRLWLPSTSQ